jgi:hypothetical protein
MSPAVSLQYAQITVCDHYTGEKMGRSLRSLALLLLSAGAACAQIPNAGFEDWTGGNPDNWVSSNVATVFINVTKSATAHSGTAAVRGEVILFPGATVAMQPVLQSGPGGAGSAISSRPASVTGWYQFSPVGGDRFGVNVVLYKGGVHGTAVAVAAALDPTARPSYYQFNVPFQYLTADVPDVCVVQHQVIGPTTGITWNVGSWFLLDDIALSGTNDVTSDKIIPRSYALDQNFPNPFNPTTVIRYQLPAAGQVHLTVLDLLGREVAGLVNEDQQAGIHEVSFNGAGMASGVYMYCLRTGSFTQTRTMVVLK